MNTFAVDPICEKSGAHYGCLCAGDPRLLNETTADLEEAKRDRADLLAALREAVSVTIAAGLYVPPNLKDRIVEYNTCAMALLRRLDRESLCGKRDG